MNNIEEKVIVVIDDERKEKWREEKNMERIEEGIIKKKINIEEDNRIMERILM